MATSRRFEIDALKEDLAQARRECAAAQRNYGAMARVVEEKEEELDEVGAACQLCCCSLLWLCIFANLLLPLSYGHSLHIAVFG